jgi:hypothetical protein
MSPGESKSGMMPEDTYVKTVKSLRALSPEQAKAKIGELAKMCNCGNCKSYTPCAKDAGEGLFCAHGTSFHCITDSKGCSCAKCGVPKAIGLTHYAFCLMGSEKDQRFDTMLK